MEKPRKPGNYKQMMGVGRGMGHESREWQSDLKREVEKMEQAIITEGASNYTLKQDTLLQ